MEQLPPEIRATYIVAVFLVLIIISFLIFVVVLYNRKQLIFKKEKQLQQAETENKLLQKEIERQHALEQERQRISHDMHDDLGAGISALKLQAQFLKAQMPQENPLSEELDLMIKTSEEMNHSMREMLWSLHTKNNKLSDFVEYVSDYGQDFFRHTPITFLLTDQVSVDTQLGSTTRRNLFLCVKEALNNALKHSQANNVWINIEQQHNSLSLSVIDDGIGLTQQETEGYGMQTMQQRMEQLNGSFQIDPAEQGTHLKFTVMCD